MSAQDRLTWHAGSIRPFASLWHTVQRAMWLNRLRLGELPAGARNRGERPSHRGDADLLFNERVGGAEVIDIGELARVLGEQATVFEWSHLGRVPGWARVIIHPGFRLCPQCLAGGYHSALLSLRLLDACPIHGCTLLERCGCGRAFEPTLRAAAAGHAGHCVCGRLSLFTPESCRTPSMPVEQTRAMAPVADWLDALSSVIRPTRHHGSCAEAAQLPSNGDGWSGQLAQWCDELGLGYPACMAAPPAQARRHACRALTGMPRQATRVAPAAAAGHHGERAGQRWEDNPTTWTCRALARYLRRHALRRPEHWVRRFMAWPDPLGIAEHLRGHRSALLAFGAMLWAREVETLLGKWQRPSTQQARDVSGVHAVGRISVPDMGAHADALAPGAGTWLEYHAAGATLAALWQRAMRRASDCARSGIADWSDAPRDDSAAMSWSARVRLGHLHFVSLCIDSPVDWAPARRSKHQRRQEQQDRLLRRHAAAAAACVGPCLTWSDREGWSVAVSVPPTEGATHRHRLLGISGDRVAFWIFRSGAHFVARSCDVRLQVLGETPVQAIEMLRSAVRQYRRIEYPCSSGATVKPAAPLVTLHRLELDAHRDFRAQIAQARHELGFWRCQGLLEGAVDRWLGGRGQHP